jgi:hypothetical protein
MLSRTEQSKALHVGLPSILKLHVHSSLAVFAFLHGRCERIIVAAQVISHQSKGDTQRYRELYPTMLRVMVVLYDTLSHWSMGGRVG